MEFQSYILENRTQIPFKCELKNDVPKDYTLTLFLWAVSKKQQTHTL